MLVAGVDMGSTKTGLCLFKLGPDYDELLEATTIEITPLPTAKAKKRKGISKKKKKSIEVVSTMFSDFTRGKDMAAGIWDWLLSRKPEALFVEMPNGGAQGARANRCMGGATFLLGALLIHTDIEYELFESGDVERTLNISVTHEQVSGMTKADKTAWKKRRIQDVVSSEWPLFSEWPETSDKAEDAYDAAAAFMCGRVLNRLYAKLKERLK
jgi:hypothetical protein